MGTPDPMHSLRPLKNHIFYSDNRKKYRLSGIIQQIAIFVKKNEECKIRVLVVEDDLSTRKLQRFIIERSNYEVVEAEDAEQALQLLEVEPPDIILSDILMPGLNGIEFVRRLKRDPKTARIPVLLCTSVSEQASVQEALSLDIAGYLLKPIAARDLLRKMNRAEKLLEPILRDPQTTMLRLGLNPAEFRELLIMLTDQAKGRIMEIGGQVEAGEFDEFSKFSHDLSTSADNFGAIALRNAAREAGTNISEADVELRQRYVFSVASQVDRVRSAASRFQ